MNGPIASMQCDEVRDALPDYLAGGLPAEANLRLQQHLESCSACALEVSTLERTWGDMNLLGDEQPSEALRARFYTRLHEAERAAARTSWIAGLGGALAALWPRRPALQMATAAATLVLGVAIGLRVRNAAPPVAVVPAGGSPTATAVAAIPTVPAAPAPGTPAVTPVSLPQPAPAAATASDDVHALREEVRSLSHLVALSLLRNDSAADRLQGVSYSREAGAGGDPRVLAALLEAANRDPNDNVRLAAIDALKPLLGRGEVRDRLLRGFDEQKSPLVQIALVDAVASASGRDAAPTLRSLLAHPNLNPAVRQRLENNLGARS